MSDRAPFDEFVATLGIAGLETSQLFGKPCAKMAGHKPVLSWFQGAMVFKLGAERCAALMHAHDDCVPFDPSGKGRPFKDWVQVHESAGLDWAALAHEALAHT